MDGDDLRGSNDEANDADLLAGDVRPHGEGATAGPEVGSDGGSSSAGADLSPRLSSADDRPDPGDENGANSTAGLADDAETEPSNDSSGEDTSSGGSAPKEKAPSATPAPAKVGPAPMVAEDGDFRWYVLRVQSGREDTVSQNLRKKLALTDMAHLVNDIVVLKQKVTEIKEGQKRVREQKLFPGYVFVQMILEDDLWYLIRDTSGIGDFVGSHQKPIPMTPSEVDKIVSIMEEKEREEVPEVKIDLVKGDAVKIKEGPFENFDGVVDEVQPAKGMVRVMVTIFGRSTPVDLEYWQVEKL